MAPPASSSSSSAATSVQVAVRIRPSTAQDAVSIPARFQRTVVHALSTSSVSIDPVSATPSSAGAAGAASASAAVSASPAAAAAAQAKKQLFTFDQVHPPETTQHALFTSTAQPLLARFLEGFNCTILAYGQTSSGKTFSMTGQDLDADPSDPTNNMGIIPRAVATIFARARDLRQERGTAWQYSLKGSFIEIYNEDLIDLLADGGRSEVQIRENKDGSILWGGLREIAVKSPAEVMQLIRQGTSIRRTNETDMNAQSSRSHAIFSLTLTQRKFVGAGAPPRSPSPLPGGAAAANGRSPSRLARPGSMFTTPTRVTSPTNGRPGTPSGASSFVSAMARGGAGGIPRPASSLGHHLDTPRKDDGSGGAGEWTTVVSKFHFVDLAGSERLKRTAAAGERIKEGISINSGLLALGNVISALGDPSRARSHTASYVPYRDSKLTRLLQDSLGGNAHTLMIACVSAAEWNAAETVNTLKYANRARNIKNRATVNEREEGWDDVEWLQATVSRLRKELKVIKEGGALPASTTSDASHLESSAASKRLLQSLDELKQSYEDLREKYVARNEELARLRREHGEHHRANGGGAIPGMSKYEEIVGPVIEEYEKSISSLEAELALNRAALRHTNDLVEEKEEELGQLAERKEAAELYVEELRSRLAKVTEREALTEAYVRDLEEKLKQHDDTQASSSESLHDLRRELTRLRDAETQSAPYIAELETRLASADESALALRATVERLEAECERRRAEAAALHARLDDVAGWRTDLDEREARVRGLEDREARVRDLEARLAEVETARQDAAAERARLGAVASDVAAATAKRLSALAEANASASSLSSAPASGTATPHEPDLEAENALVALRQTHTATLADLSAVSAKYRDALREISDLAAQIQELKIAGPAAAVPPPIAESPERAPSELPAVNGSTGGRRRVGREGSLSTNGSRRLFFRNAASTESLHTRSLSQSQSLSQELSSAHSRKTSFSSHSSPSPGSSPLHRPTLSISLPAALQVGPQERSPQSLEREIMRLQDVLREREAEIAHLEQELKERATGTETPATSMTPAMSSGSTPAASESESPVADESEHHHLAPQTVAKFEKLRNGVENGLVNGNGHVHHDSVSAIDPDEQLERLNELMRAMAQKESQHREAVDDLNSELTQLRRQHDELTVLSTNQTLNMSNEIAALRKEHEADLGRLEDVIAREAELQATLATEREQHATARREYEAAVAALRAEHEQALQARTEEVDALVARLKDEHAAELSGARAERDIATAALERARADHEAELHTKLEEASALLVDTQRERDEAASAHAAAITTKEEEAARTDELYYNDVSRYRAEHADALRREAEQHAAIVARMQEEHAAALRVLEIAREGSLSETQEAQAQAMRGLQDEHATALARREAAFAEDLERARDEHARALASQANDHSSAVEKLRAEHAALLAKTEERLAKAEEQLVRLSEAAEQARREHEDATRALRAEAEAALIAVKEQQATIMEQVASAHQDEVARLTSDHTVALGAVADKTQAEHDALVQAHAGELATMQERHALELATAQDEAVKRALMQVEEEHAALVQSHSGRALAAQEEHDAAIKAVREQADVELANIIREHTERAATARAEHEKALAELHTQLVAEQEGHREALEAARQHSEATAAAEKARLSATVAKLEAEQEAERATLVKDMDLLRSELDSYKAAAEEHALARAQDQEKLEQHAETISNLHQDLSEAHNEREELAQQLAALHSELSSTTNKQSELIREASKRESLVQELEKHRSVLAETQRTLQRVKDEKDAIQDEKAKQENMMRELQAQLARVPSPTQEMFSSPTIISRPLNERAMSHSRSKLPPPTPPPSVPPPPAPAPPAPLPRVAEHHAQSSVASTPVSTSSSRDSEMMMSVESPATSVTPSMTHATATPQPDPKLLAQVEEQTRTIEEQEAMIKTLNKQLTHCESDLQAHMDLVTTLETSLGDSEKNLRKARMQATELARERDTVSQQLDTLRGELAEAKREVVSVRRSIVEEKQSLEHRLDEERRAKERARQQLDTRMEELQKRKSKFVCL